MYEASFVRADSAELQAVRGKLRGTRKRTSSVLKPSKAQWSQYVPPGLELIRSASTVYLCVLCGCENKQRLFPNAALSDWFL
jgi:hypothetical protein